MSQLWTRSQAMKWICGPFLQNLSWGRDLHCTLHLSGLKLQLCHAFFFFLFPCLHVYTLNDNLGSLQMEVMMTGMIHQTSAFIPFVSELLGVEDTLLEVFEMLVSMLWPRRAETYLLHSTKKTCLKSHIIQAETMQSCSEISETENIKQKQ